MQVSYQFDAVFDTLFQLVCSFQAENICYTLHICSLVHCQDLSYWVAETFCISGVVVCVVTVQPVQDSDGEHWTSRFVAVAFRSALHCSWHCKSHTLTPMHVFAIFGLLPTLSRFAKTRNKCGILLHLSLAFCLLQLHTSLTLQCNLGYIFMFFYPTRALKKIFYTLQVNLFHVWFLTFLSAFLHLQDTCRLIDC